MRQLPAIVFLILWAAIARDGAAEPVRLGIWCEFMPYEQVEPYVPILARFDCDLLLHVERDKVGDPSLARLCREARRQGVAVTAWFLLPYDEHLYVGEESLAAIRDLSTAFADWSRREELGVSNVVFDCEPSPLLGRVLFEQVRKGNIAGLARTMKKERDPIRMQRSIDELNGLIDDLHAKSFRVFGAGNRVFLDFLHRGNPAIEDALNAPFTMIRWDEITFIAYRYRAGQPDYVAMINRYALLGHRYFGDRAGLDLGLTGDHRGIPENVERAHLFGGGAYFMSYLEGMRSTLDLKEVAGVAVGRGIRRINLYSLDGAVASTAGLAYWLRAAREAEPPKGFEAWTPIRSVQLGFTGFLLDRLFRFFVGAPDERSRLHE